MNSHDIYNLSEAYLEVYEDQQLDELSVGKMLAYMKAAKKDRDVLTKKWDAKKEKVRVLGREGKQRAARKIKKKTGKYPHQMNALDKVRYAITREEVDIYDIILSHLIDGGYAETPEAAEVIMVNMSEDWRDSIVEAEIQPPREPVGALTNIEIPKNERDEARKRTLAKAKAKREKNKN